jgi:MOB kinase activator 1
MASLLTTMYEFLKSSPSAQPLSPHLTFKQSSSCVTINSYTFLATSDQQYNGNRESHASPSPSPSPSCSPTTQSRAAQLLRQGLDFPSGHSNNVFSSNARTRGQFKPQRANKGTTSYQLRQFAEATLGSGSLRKAVKLPEGEDLNEWLAVNGEAPEKGGQTEKADGEQWSTFTTRSICSMAPSRNSALRSHVPR